MTHMVIFQFARSLAYTAKWVVVEMLDSGRIRAV